MDEHWASLSLTIRAEDREAAEEWLRGLARDLLGMQDIVGISFHVGEDSEVMDEEG